MAVTLEQWDWDSCSMDFLEKAMKGAGGCPVCHGMGFVGDGTCNCCAAGAWARRLMGKTEEYKSKEEEKS